MSEWANGTLADAIASLNAGVSVNAEDRPHGAGEIGVLKTSAISGGAFRAEQNKAVLQHERRLVAEPVQADSILVSRMNTPALVGESCYVRDAHPTLFLPDRLWQLKPKNRAQLDMRWLSFVLQSADYRRYVEVHATGTSGSMKNLPKSKLLALPVQYPEPAEQSVIAQILDTLDIAIHATEALIDKLKAVKQGLLHDLLTRGIDANGQLRPPQSEAPQLYKKSPLGWIPREWEVVKLGAILSELGQGWSPDCPSEPAGVGEWGVLKTTSVVWGGYNEDENKQLPVPFKPRPDLEVKSDDILITRAGPKSRVGVVAHVPSTRPQLMISDKIYRLRLLSSDVPAYFALALSAGYMQSAISRTVSGMAESQTNISQGVIKGLAILRPIREEQHAIVAHARAFDERLRAEALSLSKLQAQKNGLMDDLLTGRVRVTSLLDEVAC